MRQIGVALRCLGAATVLIGFSFACGNDTSSTPDDKDGGSGGTSSDGGTGGASDGDGGTAGQATGGTDGSASGGSATSSSGGTSASSTMSTTSATTSSTTGSTGPIELEYDPNLGKDCASDDDCGDLICVTAESNSLAEGGPANGLCTVPCTDTCEDVGPDAVCLTYGEGGDSYCLPLCTVNDDRQECGERPDMMCELLPASTGMTCTTDTDCGSAFCIDGECLFPLPVCLPKCRYDGDCPDDRFCDPWSGECVDEEPMGLGLNETCDATATADECRGYCDSQSGRCLERCAFGVYPACGSDSLENGTAECLLPVYAGDLETFAPGDVGYCFALCDCTSDCPEGLSCIAFATPGIDLDQVRGREGFCGVELDGDVILSCDE